MSEHLRAPEPRDTSAAEKAALVAAVATERAEACGALSTECSEGLNQTPEGRLRFVCAKEGLSLNGADPETLLQNKLLAVGFRKPLPMAPPLRERCVAILSAELKGEAPAAADAMNTEVIALQAETKAEDVGKEESETRVAGKKDVLESSQAEEANLDRSNEETAEKLAQREQELAVANAVIDDFFQTRVATGTLAQIREQIKQELENNPGIAEKSAAYAAANEKYIAPHEARLTAMQSVFTSEEVQTVFGGNMAQTVSLNLRAEGNAAIYADVFARIDAGIMDENRRKEVRTQVAAQLGVSFQDVEPPANASELQASLKNGRGTEKITETQTVEEPPGSGNFVEKEVVVGEERIPFTEKDRLVLSRNPLITVFPDPPGGTQHRVEGEVGGGDPVHIFVDIPPEGAFPAADINNRMNDQMQSTVFRNNGMTGVLEYFHGRGDSSLGAAAETDFDSIGQNDMNQAITQAFIGENTTLGGRFLTGNELYNMGEGLRHLTPGGEFGAFNQLDPATANSLMTAMFGAGKENIVANLDRARPFINTGGAETPSFEALYAKMHPDDVLNGYLELQRVIGESGLARLNLKDRVNGSEEEAS